MDNIVVLGACATILGVVWSIKREGKSDNKKEAEDYTALREEMKYISRGIDDIKYDAKSTNNILAGLTERTIRNEEAIKNVRETLDSHIKKGEK